MKISWANVGFTEQGGDFQTAYGLVTVTHRQIAIWKDEPTARFTLVPYSTISPPKKGYVLGSYEVPD
jgi:hypothetical protein